jgi:hypothetical protein
MHTVNYKDNTALVSSREGMRAGPAPAMPPPPPRQRGGGVWLTHVGTESTPCCWSFYQSPSTQTSHILTRLVVSLGRLTGHYT